MFLCTRKQSCSFPSKATFFKLFRTHIVAYLVHFLFGLGNFTSKKPVPLSFSFPCQFYACFLFCLNWSVFYYLSVQVKVYKIHDNIFYNIYQAYFFLCMFNSQMEFHGGLLKLTCLSIEILQLILLDYTCAKPYYTHFSWVKLLLLSIKEVKPTKIFTSCIKTCYVMNNAWWT